MRIVTWNMNYGARSAEQRQQAWDYLRSVLRADVALVQEAVPPDQLKQVYRPVGDGEGGRNYRWGSAVVALHPGLDVAACGRVPLAKCYMTSTDAGSLPDSHPGACAVADVLFRGHEPELTVISLYGQFEGMAGEKWWDATSRVHRMLSDLTSILGHSGRRQVVLAGDWNIGTQLPHPTASRADAEAADAVFARLRAWGLTDCIAHTSASRPRLDGCACLRPDQCSHARTIRFHNRVDSPPTQLDYVYASKPVVSRVRSCEVVDDEPAWALSDHCPIVLELAD
jgi:exonuclease III